MPDKVLDTLYLKYFKGIVSYRGIQRIETYPVARSALREAVLNAVVHKDYSTGVPIQIKVFPEKVVIYNTGGLPEDWTIDKLLSTHGSNQRNPMIAGSFFRSGMIETWGRGIEKIIAACREEGKPAPMFDAERTEMMVTFVDNRQQQNTETADDGCGANFGANCGANCGVNFGANAAQQKILDLIIAYPNIKVQEIADLTTMSKRKIEYEIFELKKLGIVERVGASKNGSWIVHL